ncbi:MAG: hypothetical protein E7422_01640 [Ruminococcaceae bacterium]|nr:hypothetical protein [Oscillospiraceae bacterium]
MKASLQISSYCCMTYCYGGYRDIPHVNIDSFANRLSAAREEEKTAAEKKAEEEKTGLSEEDIKYLKEHYSGELTAVEVVRAVRMVYSMGGMTHAEYCAAWGLRLEGDKSYSFPVHPELFSDVEWGDVRFQSAPITGFRSLDDILKWLDELRGDDPEWELLRMGLENQ